MCAMCTSVQTNGEYSTSEHWMYTSVVGDCFMTLMYQLCDSNDCLYIHCNKIITCYIVFVSMPYRSETVGKNIIRLLDVQISRTTDDNHFCDF